MPRSASCHRAWRSLVEALPVTCSATLTFAGSRPAVPAPLPALEITLTWLKAAPLSAVASDTFNEGTLLTTGGVVKVMRQGSAAVPLPLTLTVSMAASASSAALMLPAVALWARAVVCRPSKTRLNCPPVAPSMTTSCTAGVAVSPRVTVRALTVAAPVRPAPSTSNWGTS